MKKKIFMSVSALAVVALAALTGYNAQSSETTVADLMLKENIEALAAGDNNKFADSWNKDCGGYRNWCESGFLQRKRTFYDCLCNLRSGYSPKDDCK